PLCLLGGRGPAGGDRPVSGLAVPQADAQELAAGISAQAGLVSTTSDRTKAPLWVSTQSGSPVTGTRFVPTSDWVPKRCPIAGLVVEGSPRGLAVLRAVTRHGSPCSSLRRSSPS